MAFKDIRGQESAVKFFRNSVNRDRLAHAYLFLGPQNSGKTLLAKNLVKFLNCETPLKDDNLKVDCCDRCSSCRKIDNFNHPDVHWIEGGGTKRILIDDIRLLQKEIALKTYEGRFKAFIILEVNNITEEAANSLLKTLEEPPGFSLIILTATTLSGLLPTIISRCQIVKFYLLAQERLKEILISEYGLSAEGASFLSAQSEGRIGRALSLKDSDILYEKNNLIDKICRSGHRFSAVDIFNIKDKKKLANQILYLLNWFRDILILKTGLPEANIINIDRIGRLKSQIEFFSFQDLEQIIQKIEESYRLIEQNINPKIALEVMLRRLEACRK